MRVRFLSDYNHRWPSRAATFFRAGYEGTVKREVGETAIGKGVATELPSRASLRADGEIPDMEASGRVAERNDVDDVGAVVQHQVVDGASE